MPSYDVLVPCTMSLNVHVPEAGDKIEAEEDEA